jgi:D-alanine-D-alanine ligase-like ATP-grasp enzyme
MNKQPISTEHIDWSNLKICVLLPDYSTGNIDYANYDPPRNLSHLIPSASFTHVFLNKLTTYKQLKALKKQGFHIFVNLCEGYLEWEVPSIDVIYFLELLQMPFTGPTSLLYDPSKELMKYVAYTAGIKTPPFAIIDSIDGVETNCAHLHYPLFVKPAKAGDSLGIDSKSLVNNSTELQAKIAHLLEEYDELLVEEYIAGREFTVMLAANGTNDESVTVFKPIEYIFPDQYSFKTYSLKTSELHPNANIEVTDKALDAQLRGMASAVFTGFGGVGYARIDCRMDDKGDLYFLEINFTCSVFYQNGYEGSADYILQHDGYGQANFLQHIIAEGMYRHQQQQKIYHIKGNSIAGYGIYAAQNIVPNQLIFKGEERAQRIVTKRYVEQNWTADKKEIFRKYAYPVSKEVFLLWDTNPAEWAPQNHSCSPNTQYDGLNVIAITPINKGDELTLNYASFLDENMEPFNCRCGAPNCKGFITGTVHNSVTAREIQLRNSAL